nr:hypothetical protein [Candidatus Sigynarchaeota archaeon]
MKELSADEYHLMEYLKEFTGSAYIPMRVKNLSISEDALMAMVKKMEQAGFIASKIDWPLGSGEHNFQEKNRSVNPIGFTNIRTNVI